MDNDFFYKKLKQIQNDPLQASAYNSNDNMVVIAGPGSGKTTILTLKIMRLLRDRIKYPRGLACITYGREAAQEFKEKLKELGLRKSKNIFLGTVHSFCISEIILKFAHLYPEFNIPLPLKFINTRQKRSLYNNVVKDLRFDNNMVSISDMDKERRLNIPGTSKINIPSYDVARKVAVEYEERLLHLKLVDFDSIVQYATLLIQKQEYVRKCLEAKFPWILIDEYQDLGKPLHEMILSLLIKGKIKIFAVGDPDQSIYGFNGAYPEFLNELSTYRNISTLQLETNFRSTQDIIEASKIALNDDTRKRNYKAGYRKNEKAHFLFYTCDNGMESQYSLFTDIILPKLKDYNIPLQEISILLGKNYEVQKLSSVLNNKQIPHYIPKHKYDRSDVVKWLEKCAHWLLEKKNNFNEIFDFWYNLLISHSEKIDKNYQSYINEKRKLYYKLKESYTFIDTLNNWLSFIFKSLSLKNLLSESSRYPDENENLSELYLISKEGEFADYDLSKFSKLGKPEKQITVTTRHSSKGLEFESIVMLGMEEGSFPDFRKTSQKELQEEHRIFFVCVSRAKKICCFVHSNFLNIPCKDGRIWRKECQPSIFWNMILKKYETHENTQMNDLTKIY